jgi:excisionase family DNA binding protein
MTIRRRELPADHLLTMQEAADWLRVSRWSVYSLIHANQLHTIKIGRRRLVSREALKECVTRLAKGAAL